MLRIRKADGYRLVDLKPGGDSYAGEPSFRASRRVYRVHLRRHGDGRQVESVTRRRKGERQTLKRQEFLAELAEALGQSPDDITLEGKTILTRTGLRPKGVAANRLAVLLAFRHNRRTPIERPIKVFSA